MYFHGLFFAPRFGFGLSLYTKKAQRSRAASGSSLQRAPRPAPCEVGRVRAKTANREREKRPEKVIVAQRALIPVSLRSEVEQSGTSDRS